MKTKVYYFKMYNIVTDEIIISKRPAKLETIRFCGGSPMLETEKLVDEITLDSDGFVKKAQ